MQSLLFNKKSIKGIGFNKWFLKDDSCPIIGYWNNFETSGPKVKNEQEDQNDMMKILSHDIRNPLITIGAELKLLKKGIYGEVGEEAYAELDRLLKIVTQTTSIMEDFMANTIPQSGELNTNGEI